MPLNVINRLLWSDITVIMDSIPTENHSVFDVIKKYEDQKWLQLVVFIELTEHWFGEFYPLNLSLI